MQRRRQLLTLGVALACTGLIAAACGDDDSSSSATTAGGATTAAGSATSAAGGATTTSGAKKWPAIPDGPIHLGASLSLTGAGSEYAINFQRSINGVTLPQFKAQHPDGIDGHEVVVDQLDDGSDVTKAVSVANQLVANKTPIVIKVSDSPEAATQQASILTKAKIPIFTYAGSVEFDNPTKYPYLFGLLVSPKQSGETAATWIAKHSEIKSIGVLTDNTPSAKDFADSILNPLKTKAPNVQVVATGEFAPGSVDVSTAVAKVKSANPDLVLVPLSFGYGPVWTGIRGANWTPRVMASAGAWYDGFDGMGPLAEKAVAPYNDCVTEGHPPFPKLITDLMDGFISVTPSFNYLTYVNSNYLLVELARYAIEKNHSVDPDAIKDALESMNDETLLEIFHYTYTATNHFGLTGDLGSNVCTMAPQLDGKYKIPAIAP